MHGLHFTPGIGVGQFIINSCYKKLVVVERAASAVHYSSHELNCVYVFE